MSDNLKVAKECGFFVYESHDSRMCNLTKVDGDENVLAKYTSRILASKQAAHDAEIAKLKEEMRALRTECASNMVELIGANEQLSKANERIAYLEGLVALQADALRRVADIYGNKADGVAGWLDAVRQALSASAETVQAYRDKLTEPLREKLAEREAELQRENAELRGRTDSLEVVALRKENAELRNLFKESKKTAMEFDAPRIRVVARALGCEDAIPADDETLIGCIGSVMGVFRRKIEESKVPEVTDAMALAFHRALTDGSIGSGEVEEIKIGLRAAMLAAAPQPKEPKQ